MINILDYFFCDNFFLENIFDFALLMHFLTHFY